MKISFAIIFILQSFIFTRRNPKVKDFTYDLDEIEPFDPHAPQGDSKFSKEMHQQDIDYFQIKVSLDIDMNDQEKLLINMSTYFEKWFAINPKQEGLVVNFMTGSQGQTMINRFSIVFNNKVTDFTKIYYIDVDYQNGKSSPTDYNDSPQIPLDDDVMQDPWKKKFAYTLEKEQAQSGTCANVVNQDKYVIPSVYDVSYKDSNGQDQSERVVLVGDNEISTIGEPSNTESGLVIDRDFKENIMNKIAEDVKNGADNLPDEYKSELMENEQIKSQIKDLADEIISGGGIINDLQQQSEHNYQGSLRKQLFITRMEKVSSYDDHKKTLFLMEEKSKDINEYNIELQIRRALRKSNYLHNYKIHERRQEYIKEEMKYEDLQRKLRDMEYVKDELNDKYYRKMTKIKASKQLNFYKYQIQNLSYQKFQNKIN